MCTARPNEARSGRSGLERQIAGTVEVDCYGAIRSATRKTDECRAVLISATGKRRITRDVDVHRTSGTASGREARRHADAYNRAAQIGVSALQSKVAANNVKSQRAAVTRKDGSAAD